MKQNHHLVDSPEAHPTSPSVDKPHERVGRWAVWFLLGALALAILGKVLEHSSKVPPFWAGLLLAFGEAALVGGLADWFAVRALFAHPFGIPFPHTALIPRNRPRIVAAIRDMVQHEWLPSSLLVDKVENFDLVGTTVLPLVDPLKPHLRAVIRDLGKEICRAAEPHQLAGFFARGLAGSVDAERVGPFLADLVRRTREQRWLEPLLRAWVVRLHEWTQRPGSKEMIQTRLEEAARIYRGQDWFKSFTYNLAEAFGGVDLDAASQTILIEIQHFAEDQLTEKSPMQDIVAEGLTDIETRLRNDPAFLKDVRQFILETSETGTLTSLLEPILVSLRREGLRELDSPDSQLVSQSLVHLEAWLQRLVEEPDLREQANAWCRRTVISLIDRHHSLIGKLVEEQLNRLTNENLSELIQTKVGEDLNWIRLNGTFVGGLVGVFLYLIFWLANQLL